MDRKLELVMPENWQSTTIYHGMVYPLSMMRHNEDDKSLEDKKKM